ncbi:dipeptide ABC transporter ATP-binding protein [Roseobacter sp. HKCCD9010]|uniref:ABC transporter ATP-binding protein n=1 Tax=unclassified Roseobacter TaxID=196798 RepID=UPI0014913941|nr:MULTISPECIES: dipeptide ABC transporter ATP-binding protein [unclassified Roseobacter]MBF9049457.1 dipeptide ABC transporter ATP-binding protein [Rhodobacterales bacterium HKCCD4356]NNV11457.1 dipeptide ABC transporter ATP-binding protein [Roseobacter sp. HKCCD7357]NNV15641.1 dipeptide ABC transporter ATP-binding protein [Roseobacter sp. HKCCD8768]NNV25101.1 dipeptide ABC transporter ATP-binding protein [Roseobacter sp. HKCCD8192]NNV29358.1 dipeptide ABC transporter ATP-binding protein [Ros
MSTALSARNLRKEFVTARPLFGAPTVVRAVDGVSLDIEAGETFAIVGESGCGKSTLARLLLRLIDPTDGEVWFNGEDLAHIDTARMRALRKDLQFIFQDPFSSLNPRMTVGALIAEPMEAHDIGTAESRRDRVAELLTRVGLPTAAADRFPHEFSGGQRQRIGIARALATRPTVLIGDEPVSALDVSIQAQVINLLEDLKDELGLTLVVIAHDLAVIRHMADRVAVMYLGEVVECGPADALYEQPRHPYTETLLAAIPIAEYGARRARIAVEGDPPNPIAPPPGCRFHTRCPYATDLCKTERPTLSALPDGRQVACHHAQDLTLEGLTSIEPARSAAAAERFALYARGSSASATENPNNDS